MRTTFAWSLPLLVLIAALAAASPAGSAAPRRAVLSGRLDGFTAPALGGLTVLAVNANDGTLAGVAAPKGLSYRLSVPPGPYLVYVQDEDFKASTTTGVSHVTSIGRSGGIVNVGPGEPSARAAEAAPVIAIGPLNVTAADGSGLRSGSMQGEVIGSMFDRCHDKARYRLVDANPEVIDALMREQQLRKDGRTSAVFDYAPATAGYAITGQGSADANGNVIVDLSLIDLRTGKTLDHVRGRGDAEDIHDLIRRFASGLADRNCHEGKRPGPLRPKPRKPPPRRRPTSAAGPFTATYEGTYHYRSASSDGTSSTTTDLHFNAEITVRLHGGKVASVSRTLTASGTLDIVDRATNAHCTLSASGPTKIPSTITPMTKFPGGPVNAINVTMRIPDYIGADALVIKGDPGCNTLSGTLDPHDSEPDWNAAISPGRNLFVKSLPYSKHYSVNDVVPYGSFTQTVAVSATLNVS